MKMYDGLAILRFSATVVRPQGYIWFPHANQNSKKQDFKYQRKLNLLL